MICPNVGDTIVGYKFFSIYLISELFQILWCEAFLFPVLFWQLEWLYYNLWFILFLQGFYYDTVNIFFHWTYNNIVSGRFKDQGALFEHTIFAYTFLACIICFGGNLINLLAPHVLGPPFQGTVFVWWLLLCIGIQLGLPTPWFILHFGYVYMWV